MPKYFIHKYSKYLFELQSIRFLIVGAVNTAFGLGVFSAMIMVGFGTYQGLIGSTIAGIIFNFFTYGSVVFRQLACTRVPRFVLAHVFILFINARLIEYISGTYETGKIQAQAYLVVPVAVVSYVILSNFVFRKTNATSPGTTLKK